MFDCGHGALKKSTLYAISSYMSLNNNRLPQIIRDYQRNHNSSMKYKILNRKLILYSSLFAKRVAT